jgi:hypothetical protein
MHVNEELKWLQKRQSDQHTPAANNRKERKGRTSLSPKALALLRADLNYSNPNLIL